MTEAMDRAATAYPVFYRTYSRKINGSREHWHETCDRTLKGLQELGKLTQEQSDLINEMQLGLKALTSGRWLWVGGTEWSKKQANHYGSYNCTSTLVVDWQAFGLMMNLAMQGCGTGAVLETQYIEQLPEIRNRLNVEIQGKVGDKPHFSRKEQTHILIDHRWNEVLIEVGDSREGWVKSYEELLRLSSDKQFDSNFVVNVTVDVTNVRPSGEVLKGFGGVANPIKLEGLYSRCAEILNKAVGRKLNAVECCLLIDEAALVVVAGNVRRCLPKGALVHTESGLVPIEKVRIGDRVLTSKGYYPVTNFFVQGEQSLCRIETEDGFLECTADHKVAVLSDVFGEYKMIKAKDLAQGDRLVFVPTSIKGLPTELPENRFVSTGKTKHIQVPALTADVAYFLGYFHGNGSVSTDGNRIRVTVPVGWNVIVDRLVLVANQFGISDYKLSDLTKNNVQAVELAFNSVALNHYFGQFKQAYQSPVIPDCILQGTENIRKAYLSGLADADGCHSQAVLVASNYRSFLLKIQTLYASLGVTTRVCQSIRKSTGRWEGELVTVGEHAFDSVSEWFDSYSLKWAVQKKERPKSFKDHGFPKDMVRPLVSSYLYGWGSTQKQMIVPTVKKFVKTATELIPVAVKSVVFDVDVLETFDIEVASIHEFVCNGLLVSNSAGMRQFSENDKLAEVAKDNLWQQSEDGSWRIDPERDALRMANHTRVFHHKPSLNECIASVTKQYYSGEGAIQYAPEAIARANADLLITTGDKHQFLKLYEQGIDVAKHWLAEMFPSLTERELVHRLQRYGLNPCLTADTWVHTENGARQIKDLIGKQVSVYVNGELFSTTPEGFFFTGNQPVVTLQTKEGFSLRLTENHQLLKVTSQTQRSQYTQWVQVKDLQAGDRILLHDHRSIQPWDGEGSFEEGWLIGNLLGDGSLCQTQWNDRACLRYWGETKEEMASYAVKTLERAVNYKTQHSTGCYHKQLHHQVVNSAGLATLAAKFGICPQNKTLSTKIEETSYSFYCGFLRGFFDADGSVQGSQEKGVSVRLAQSDLNVLQAVQRMLARVGIITSIYQQRRSAGLRMLPNSHRELAPYYCKDQHELVIANDNLEYFANTINFQDPLKSSRLQEALNAYSRKMNRERFTVTIANICDGEVEPVYDCTVPQVSRFDANGFVAHNCGEIIGSNFFCNLAEIHLNQIDPLDIKSQRKAFTAGGLSVAVLLNHQFVDRRYQESREADPIVGVSFTGLFDFFVDAFGVDWLRWWEAGRPANWFHKNDDGFQCPRDFTNYHFKHLSDYFFYKEMEYLSFWKETATKAVTDYCLEHGLKAPNRCTTVQPSGCLTKDAIRVFDQGLFFADEHMESASGDCDLQDYGLTVRDGVHVLAGIANEQRSLIRITLENGRQLTMTPDHRLSIGGQWVEASKMTVGQEIDYQIGNYRNANEALLDHVDLPLQGTGRPAKGCLLPDKMSPQLGYFIGALFGNGHISEHHYRLRFSHGSLAVLHRISEIGLELFGLEGVLTQQDTNKYELCFANKQLYLWFLANGIEKPAKSRDLERIPVKLRQSSRQSLLAFFAGLIDTDGCIRAEGSLSIDSASELFVRHLQQVGEAVGLSFSVFANNQGQNWQDTKDMHGMCLSRMKSDLNSIEFLNRYSIKAKHRPIHPVKRTFSFNPYRIAIIETGIVDYTFDYTVESQNDDDAWYWQGALKSHNSKSLLTGASPGWHPPKAQRFIRRITFRKNDPVALACIDYGYSVVPSQSDKDENGNLLNDPFDPRCTEWLVEIPVEVPWANLEGADSIDISKFSALAQFDFYMQVQRHYTTHNTSSTIELRSDEIEPLATAIYETIRDDGGYISSALLARFDDLQTYPRMPFEPIDKHTYDRLFAEMLLRRKILDFHEALLTHDEGLAIAEAGPAGCDSDKCLIGGNNNK